MLTITLKQLLKMKPSKYNIYYNDNVRYFIYNQLTGFMSEFDAELYNAIRSGHCLSDLSDINKDYLKNGNFICENDLNESMVFLMKNRKYRYNNNIARITIMPTLDCNFRCWYCYEEHFHSRMDEATVNATIKFCKTIIDSNNLKVFSLDWFGGEPLVYFNEVVYPISKEIMNYCEEKRVVFTNGITTNGYLIDKKIIDKFKEIKLSNFQITLDGSEEFHNKTRFSQTDRNTYTTIVKNIELLVDNINSIAMTVRINYTPANMQTIDEIADSFRHNIRNKIKIMPQIVWQYKDKINAVDTNIHDKLTIFSRKGYKAEKVYLSPTLGVSCYTENMLQFVINYDKRVYKCTARDFKNKHYSIGAITQEGVFIPNSNYYNYFTASAFENKQCLECEFLPSCCGMCIQKKLEKGLPVCPKKELENSILNQLKLVVQKMDMS